jgi:hypothetical protein
MREEEEVDYEKRDNHTAKRKSEHVTYIVAGNAFFSSFVDRLLDWRRSLFLRGKGFRDGILVVSRR